LLIRLMLREYGDLSQRLVKLARVRLRNQEQEVGNDGLRP